MTIQLSVMIVIKPSMNIVYIFRGWRKSLNCTSLTAGRILKAKCVHFKRRCLCVCVLIYKHIFLPIRTASFWSSSAVKFEFSRFWKIVWVFRQQKENPSFFVFATVMKRQNIKQQENVSTGLKSHRYWKRNLWLQIWHSLACCQATAF